ncbi:unnamed protein product, partial [Laminaria digitata]
MVTWYVIYTEYLRNMYQVYDTDVLTGGSLLLILTVASTVCNITHIRIPGILYVVQGGFRRGGRKPAAAARMPGMGGMISRHGRISRDRQSQNKESDSTAKGAYGIILRLEQ